MTELAMFGGPRSVPRDAHGGPWPVVTPEDEQAVLRVLRSGRLTATAAGETEVAELERSWAARVGVPHCVATSSGTTALQLALAALGVGPGDEVVVPALTMNATAQAVLQCNATPVFADIDPATYTLAPAAAAEASGPRTAALLPVHLHGLIADMDGLAAAAPGAPLIEDAAQAHGATYRGRVAGSLGALGCFSLHPSKNLPTCGEGGLVTTADPELHRTLDMLRTFGERPPSRTRSYISHRPGGNARMSPVQAAFTRSQLERTDGHTKARDTAVTAFLDRIAALPGIGIPHVPADRTHVWHIIRLRLVPEEIGLEGVPASALRRALHRVLRAEGVPVSQYQAAPLPAHPAFRTTGADEIAARFPHSCAAVNGTLCLQRRQLGPEAATALSAYADAFEKVWGHLDLVRRVALGQPALDWRHAVEED